jgi:hypothetical protein
MLRKSGSLATAMLLVLGTVSQTAAGGRAQECYERYHTPPVYDTIHENVEVHPAGRHVEYTPPIHGTRKRLVLISSERVGYEVIPARYTTEYRKVKVDDGGFAWEWRVIDGRKVLCKVKRKARYEVIAEKVLVRPEQTRRYVIPAKYTYEIEKVLIQPKQKRVIHVRPSYQTVERQVVVSEGSSGWARVRIPKHCG